MGVKDLNIEDLQALRDDEPVVMVNMVRLKEKASTGEVAFASFRSRVSNPSINQP